MLKQPLFAFVLVLATATSASAQALPITKRPVSREEYAGAVERNDQTILNADCQKIVAAVNTIFGFEQQTCEDHARYLRRLNEYDVPEGFEASFARILPNGNLDLYGLTREVRKGERFLFDNQAGVWVCSLMCGNMVTKNKWPIPGATATATPERIGTLENLPVGRPLAGSAQERAETLEPKQKVRRRHTAFDANPPWWSFKRTTGKIFWGSVGAVATGGVYCAVTKKCFSNTQTVTVIF